MSLINKTICFIFALPSFITACNAQQNMPAKVAVAFYNVENLFDTIDQPGKFDEDFTPSGAYHYTGAIYQQKLHNLANVISEIATDKIPEGPALIGLAEIENEKVLDDLVNEPKLMQRHFKIIHFDSPDSRGIDVALLYQPEYFKLIRAKALPVEIIQNNKREHTRDILYVVGKLAGDTCHIFVNHWPSRREGKDSSAWKRAKAASVAKLAIDKIMLEHKNAKIIIMGDLNDDPIDSSILLTLNTVTEQTNTKPGGLFNPWYKVYEKKEGTSGYQGNWHLFDQIIVSYGFTNPDAGNLHFDKAVIFNPDFIKNSYGKYKGFPHRSFAGTKWINGYSDHFPTIIYLKKDVN